MNDAFDLATHLANNCGFQKSDIRLLTDGRATTAGILERLGWLTTGLRPRDRIFFGFSGHGAQVATRTLQGEVDDLDEVICPVDFDWSEEHMIRDKDFARLFSGVPAGVQFIWVSDSCNSADLTKGLSPILTQSKSMPVPVDIAWRNAVAAGKMKTPLGLQGATVEARNVALLSGCKSNRESGDAIFNGRPNGVLTHFLLEALKAPPLRNDPLDALIASVSTAVAAAGFVQEPQVEGSPAIRRMSFF